MQKPRRTRFFASRSSTDEILNLGEHLRIDEPARGESTLSPALDETTAAPGNSEPPASGDLADLPPSWLRILNTRRVRRQSRLPIVLVALGCLALGLLGGFFGSRYLNAHGDNPTASGASEGRVSLTPAEQGRWEAAYRAAYLHRYAEAEVLFTALGRQRPEWATVDIELSRVLLQQGKISKVRTLLNQASTNALTAASAHFMLGVTSLVQNDFLDTETNLAAAVATDPTRPEYYYQWGDCLRAQGKPFEAMQKFRSALLRNRYETADGLYRVKTWLCEIDANQENSDGLGAAITAGLAQSLPSMEILVAAAARDLKAGDFPAAAAHLRRARERADAKVFHIVVNDPTFIQVRTRPEMADIFQSEPNPAAITSPSPGAPASGK